MNLALVLDIAPPGLRGQYQIFAWNRGAAALADVVFESIEFITVGDESVPSTPAQKRIDHIAPGSAVLIEEADLVGLESGTVHFQVLVAGEAPLRFSVVARYGRVFLATRAAIAPLGDREAWVLAPR